MSTLVVGVTGASGAIYAHRFVLQAARRCDRLYLIVSEQAKQVAETELSLDIGEGPDWTRRWLGADFPNLELLAAKDYFTPPASGSFRHDGMVIVPCSMGTVGRIASGVSDDLLTRCADVCLKEGRKLIVVPREMPWNLIMLRNLTRLAEAGATIMPACPAWYSQPKSLDDLADTVVARILQNLGMDQDLVKPWMEGFDRR